ncbi:peptidylprolyl isomerase [Ochrobactrum soli]|uniref:Survival protein SurA (Peptidyl-prolyl cis-trans isomerase SurA) n=1 Tax=Ochrobactrum soli TaxID=2448455 RepID=A0A2P9HLD6_9HYPH|nr:peptidylprolyl isomerase [[Ochrobactrum] soli]RLL76348.1 peptidylprolyl isomerase [[Ochrobactrum] soli]SPL64926.1 Survival protein SurA precursor (Peptidyl-prolyl cis-trans isomerase SurA) [[Ochrobactrum] soli]
MMFARPLFASLLSAAVCLTALGTVALPTSAFAAGEAEVKVVVSGNAITNGDIQRRAAFLKLQRKGGNTTQLARQELTDEMLKRIEMKSRGINVSDQEVDQAYAGFASRNKMTLAQLNQVLNQAGVTPDHFKKYIMVQMGWGRLVSARFRATGMVSEQDAVQRMLKDGGKKPVATEYHLQQVIFVVPTSKRSPALLAKRRQEANALRSRFQSCDATRQQAKGIIDVTVRDLGRIIEQQLPGEWSKDVKAAGVGRTTPPHDTEKGVEFLAVCATRQLSDDRVAQLVFSMEGADTPEGQEKKADALATKYLDELRKKATIVNR